MAVMAYPSMDAAGVRRRDELQRLWLYESYLDSAGDLTSITIPVQARDLRFLLDLNPEGIHNDYHRSCQMGSIAGSILYAIGMLAQSDPGTSSVRKAIELRHQVQSFLPEIGEAIVKTSGDSLVWRKGKPPWTGQSRQPLFNTSKAKLYEYWGNYKPVAHLWAAYGYNDRSFNLGLDSVDDKEILLFLADAEHLRRFGEHHFARAQEKHNNSTLDPSTTWKIPNDLHLPESLYATNPPELSD